MKTLLRTACSISLLFAAYTSGAQCTQAQLNWDNLDYYYNSAGIKPYGSFITTAQAQTQKFAIGTTYATFNTPAVATFISGENATHTGDVTVSGVSFTGEDAQFTPTANGQAITITFGTEVQDVRFTIYDLDADAQYTITAMDALSFPKTINATFQSPTILTTNNASFVPTNNTTSLILSSTTGSNIAESANDGTATIYIAGAVKQITLNLNFFGTDAKFFLSDITACVSGSFPINYHQMPGSQPYTGQPSYFLSTPDNASVFMVGKDAFTTGTNYVATKLFTDGTAFVNSIAYDIVNGQIYYVIDGTGATNAPNNKLLKRYDALTGNITTVCDVNAVLGIPTFDGGVESAGACFYDGALYFGIEGGHFNEGTTGSPIYTTTRESIIYKIEFDASLNPVNAYQVFAVNAYDPAALANTFHDWGDFIIKDGILYDFNTAKTASNTFPNSAIHKFDLMTGAATRTVNPTPASPYVGQIALDWSGNLYSVRTGVQSYTPGSNTLGASASIAPASGSGTFPIPSGVGDASEPYRPPVDMGDAPASYDPVALSPALHDFAENTVRLGNTIDREWTKTSSASANADGADEDGVPIVYVYNNGINYSISVNVFNNPASFTTATVCAWLDFNLNGTFEASEGISRTVNKSNAMQSVSLTWTSALFPLANNTNTYLRIRIASDYSDASKRLTTSKPTGYMPNGEVEDYFVLTSTWLLPLNSMEFNVDKIGKDVNVQWNFGDDEKVQKYVVMRSADAVNFAPIAEVKSNKGKKYSITDRNPLQGKSYYRLEVVDVQGKSQMGDIRSVVFEPRQLAFSLQPNPTAGATTLIVSSDVEGKGKVTVYNATGLPVYTQAAQLQKGSTRIWLNTEFIPDGTYIVEIQHDQFTERKKLIVRK